MDRKEPFDVVIIGAGVAGSAMAHALSTIPRPQPWRIGLIERSFSEPDRIVGEFLQPGGVEALRELDMLSSLDGIEAVPLEGYHIIRGAQSIQGTFPNGKKGRSFHHGRFVMALRRTALRNENVTPIEGQATRLIECATTQRVIGVNVALKPKAHLSNAPETGPGSIAVYSGLVIIADGCFSSFRNSVLGESACKPKVYGHTISTILKHAALPVAKHGTVILPPDLGPVALYQLTEKEIRIFFEIKGTLPSDVKRYAEERVIPELPDTLQVPAKEAFITGRIRKMPNSLLPPVQQATSSSKKGVFLLGDSLNMRHPATGAGMTVALKDVLYLRQAFQSVVTPEDWSQVGPIIRRWHWARKFRVSTLNILSAALYGMVQQGLNGGAHASVLEVVFAFFRSDREFRGFLALVSGLDSSPASLMRLFVSIGVYIGWLGWPSPNKLRLGPQAKKSEFGCDQRTMSTAVTLVDWLTPPVYALMIGWELLKIALPIVFSEIRWWSPGTA